MKSIELHRQAMTKADTALEALRKSVDAAPFFKEAAEDELRAAQLCDTEPGRSIMLNSAGALFRQAKDEEMAERCFASVLVSNTAPAWTREEARQHLETEWMYRHLATDGIQLSARQIGLAISGGHVGYGVGPMEELVTRAGTITRLTRRVADARFGRKFRKSASGSDISVFLDTISAGSLAASFRVAFPGNQMALPFDNGKVIDEVISEIGQLVQAAQDGDMEPFRALGRDAGPEYERNALAQIKSLAPDGSRVTQVSVIGGKHAVAFRRTRAEFADTKAPETSDDGRNVQSVIGVVDFADGTRDEIRIAGKKIKVNPEILDDIVRPLWREHVRAQCIKDSRGRMRLIEIMRDTPKVNSPE